MAASSVSSFLVLITSFLFLLQYCHAANDTLPQGQSLTDGDTILSATSIFELGFFSPAGSQYLYLGIWYYNVTPQTVIWVANRDTPVVSSTAAVSISDAGNLQVLDQGKVIWSTNITTTESATVNVTAQLSDTGNFVLHSGGNGGGGGEGRLWASFDHPSDTFLPGMLVGINRVTGQRQLFTSWRTASDPSMGNYTLGMDPLGSAQLYIWKGSTPYWRTGQWNGQNFVGIPWRPLYIYGFKLTNSQGLMYYTYTPLNSTLQRFVLQPDGTEVCYMLDATSRTWSTVWMQPTNECQLYGTCGLNAECTVGKNNKAICSCLKGFKPNSTKEWNAKYYSGGCVSKAQLGCQENTGGDGFSKVSRVKLPDFATWQSTVTDDTGCRSACMGNCSCRAYAFNSGTGCLTWGEGLEDIYQFAQGVDGYDLFVKLPASELGSKNWIWITATVLCIVVVFVLAAYLLWWRRRSNIKVVLGNGKTAEQKPHLFRPIREVRQDFSGSSQVDEDSEDGKGHELPFFTLDRIAAATGDFSISNKLGEGGFGDVYKGKLPEGEEIAVKRLSKNSGQGVEEFRNEVILIAKLQHRNLVRLLGYCIEGEERILVYEYMPNKSLDAFLFDPAKQLLLDWKTRFEIIEGIARGLLYLHRDSRLRIIHRDLKTSNILLDKDMIPKISDFGMARIFGGDQNQESTNRVVGTLGYMSPEYAMEGLFSVKSDVYSFGILALEIITGRRNSSFHRVEGCMNIVGYAWQLWNREEGEQLIDPLIRMSCPISKLMRCIHIALLCVQDHANDRPDISSVMKMCNDSAILPAPRPPTFTLQGSRYDTKKVKEKEEPFSASDVTITALHGR